MEGTLIAKLSAVLLELESIAKETGVGISLKISGMGVKHTGHPGIELDVGGVCVWISMSDEVPGGNTPMKKAINEVAKWTRARSATDSVVISALES